MPIVFGLIIAFICCRAILAFDASLPAPLSFHELGHNTRRHDLRNITHSQSRKLLTSLLTPLYPGYGTHFSYVWVGTPPQRQSVIIDTGSHYTAFPCTGCSQCGAHTDAYWDIKNSTTAVVQQCGAEPCALAQSYSEGSSWKAFKVTDKVWQYVSM